MNELIQHNLKEQITNLTPIEFALGIDEEGRTTAKKLYEFLELDMSNYSKWAKRKILENEFAVERVDFIPFVLNDERNPNPTTDYKLSASFAKKLAMGTHNAKGEAAKNYFVKIEDKLKEIAMQSRENTLNTNNLSPELQMFNKMFQAVANVELSNNEIKNEVQAIKQSNQETKEEIQNIRDVVTLSPNQWREDTKALINKIAIKLGGFDYIKPIRDEAYKFLDSSYGVNLKARLLNKQKKMALEGTPKYKIDKINYLDVISEDKKLINGYINIVGKLVVKYGVA